MARLRGFRVVFGLFDVIVVVEQERDSLTAAG